MRSRTSEHINEHWKRSKGWQATSVGSIVFASRYRVFEFCWLHCIRWSLESIPRSRILFRFSIDTKSMPFPASLQDEVPGPLQASTLHAPVMLVRSTYLVRVHAGLA
eukprot:scaffold528612_cov51-Prasinocladus_malaysianus.AAC.1